VNDQNTVGAAVRRFDLPAKAVGSGIDVECNGPFAGKLDREQGIYRGLAVPSICRLAQRSVAVWPGWVAKGA